MTEQKDPQPDRSHLAGLYPQAKTLEQRIADRDESEARKQARRPKGVALMTSLRLYSVLIGIFLAVHLAPVLFAMGPMSGVPFTFLLLLIVAGYALWMILGIARDFAAHGYRALPLISTYVLLFPAVVYGAGRLMDPTNERLMFAASVTVIHIVTVYVLMKFLGPKA